MERIKLDLVPSCIKPVLHASQYDDGRQWTCDILNGGTPYVFQSGDTVDYTIRKGDDLLVTGAVAVTPGTSYIILVSTEQMCAVFGSNLGELTITSNGSKVGSVNFIIEVERAPDENGITSQSEIKNLARQVHDIVVEELADNGAEETGYDNTESGLEATNVQDAIDEVNAKIENIPSVDAYTKEQADDKFAAKTEVDDKYECVPNVEVSVDDSIVDENTSMALTNVTGDYANGFVFTNSNGSIEFENASVTNQLYLVEFTMSNFNEGRVFVAFGDDVPADVYYGDANTQIVLLGNGGNLKITNKTYATTITNVKCYPIVDSSESKKAIVLGTVIDNANARSGRWNVALGNNNTFKFNINGTRCIAIGVDVLRAFVSGTRNIGIGSFALHRLVNGDYNIAIGSDSLWNATKAVGCISIGKASMDGVGTDIEHNIAIGQASMGGLTTGKNNVAIGHNAMGEPSYPDASYNLCIGTDAGHYCRGYNVYIGNRAGYSLRKSLNTCVGSSAGSQLNTNGENNCFIGATSGIDNTGATSQNPKVVDNSIAIGYQARATKSNQAMIGSASVTEVVFCGNKKINFNQDGTVTWETLT